MKGKIIASTIELSHEDWLKHRKNGIGGSDAGAICGLNRFRSAIDVWHDKTHPEDIKDFDNEKMRIGRDLEDYVAKRFTELTGKKVQRKNSIIQSEEYPFMIANVDRVVVGENALLECKTTSAYGASNWTDGKCPVSYEIQCHHYMAVTGADKVYLACLILGVDFVVVIIERDEETIKFLRDIESEFWEHNIKENIMPAPQGSENDNEAIKKLYPDSYPELEITLQGKEKDLERFDELKELIADLTKEQDKIKQNIQADMKEAETAYIGERKITWKMQKGKTSVDSKKLKSEMPDVYQEYLKVGKPYRVFSIK